MSRFYVPFFLSGAAGLIYQLIWSRLLNELFGVTVYAVTTVLAIFLGGLALGSVCLGRYADRVRRPLRLFGWLEIGTGLAALAGTWSLPLMAPAHVWAANRFAVDSAALMGIRVLLGALVVLPATFLMGGTLPAITRAAVRSVGQVGRKLSLLYAVNALGAVVGVLAAGFWWIAAYGIPATTWLAVSINLIVGCYAVGIGGRERPVAPRSAPRPWTTPRASAPLIAIGVAGFAAFGLEVVWTRILVLSVGTTTYAFATILASCLVGITLGGFLARALITRTRRLRAVFGWLQLGVTMAILTPLPLIDSGLMQGWLRGWNENWQALVAVRFGASSLIMLVPTTLMGMTFPLVGRMWARDVGTLGGRIGQVYGANALGNIFGAAVTGFVIVPAVGMQMGIVLLSALTLANALWGFLPDLRPGRLRAGRVVTIVPAIVVCAAFMIAWKPEPFPAYSEQPGDRVRYYKEGVSATVKVFENGADPRLRWMTIDSITIGQSFGGVDAKQQALAHFPFLLLPEGRVRRVLSVGLGTGILIAEAARHPGIERADCVEISPEVIEASHHFDAFHGGLEEHPRVRIVLDDGLNYLRRTRERYDAIISDAKSRSAHAGNSMVLSTDYYELCLEHLEPHGVMVQWTPLDIPPRELRIVLRTFFDVFPQGWVWVSPPHSAILVGAERAPVLDLNHIDRTLQASATANLRRYSWVDGRDFVSLVSADRRGLGRWLAGDSGTNSLSHPRLEFYSPREYAVSPARRRAENLTALLEAREGLLDRLRWTGGSPDEMRRSFLAASDWIAGWALIEGQDPDELERALDHVDRARRRAPEHLAIRSSLDMLYRRALGVRRDSSRARAALAALQSLTAGETPVDASSD